MKAQDLGFLLVLFFSVVSAAQPPAKGLHLAALQGDTQAVRQHIEAGTDLDARDAYGSTPLNVATTFGQDEVVGMLVNAGADLHSANSEGMAALHLAAFFGHPDIARTLLQGGADAYLLSRNGARPYDIAAGPYARDAPILEQLAAGLAPLGFALDHAAVQDGRRAIADQLRPNPAALQRIDYKPLERGDWAVSNPQQEDLDPGLVAELYYDAARSENLRSLLIVKNGKLVAEGYFNGGGVDTPDRLASVTKSVTSALYGLALEGGQLESLDQPMLDFFPEIREQVSDPRKADITLRQLLQMRGGYPWEETDSLLWAGLLSGYYLPLLESFPLVADPGTAFNYSNLSSNWLGIILDRASGLPLRDYAIEHLFGPMGIEPGPWGTDAEGHNNGCGNLHLRPRDAARFGQLYLDKGAWQGKQLLPADWVEASLARYSPDAWVALPPQQHVGRYFQDFNYGYQWWSARVGDRGFDYAWGHGGQLIVLLAELDLVIVATSDPYWLQHDSASWRLEQGTFNLLGKFIQLLPGGQR